MGGLRIEESSEIQQKFAGEDVIQQRERHRGRRVHQLETEGDKKGGGSRTWTGETTGRREPGRPWQAAKNRLRRAIFLRNQPPSGGSKATF